MKATSPVTTDLDQLAVNTIRTLSMDAVQRANSGQPGTPMAMAPVAYAFSREAAKMAGHLKLDNLCWIYDNNRITIEDIPIWRSARTWRHGLSAS